MKVKFSLSVVCALALFSCSKQMSEDVRPEIKVVDNSDKDNIKSKIAFAKALAKVVANEEIRNLISAKAAEEFDKDYDILYHKIKNESISNTSFDDYIKSNTTEIDYEAISKDKLLNIYVPNNKNVNNLAKIKSGVPWVAVRNADNKLIAYNSDGQMKELDSATLPSFPVIVIKENERVLAVSKGSLNKSKDKVGQHMFSTVDNDYYYADDAYNPKISSRGIRTSQIDPELITAYEQNKNCNTCYHRDWIYYNIYPNGGKNEGTLNNKYAEAITAIRFTNTNFYDKMGGWDEGSYEIRVTSFYGGRTEGAFSKDLKVIPVKPEEMYLFDSNNRPITVLSYNTNNITYTGWDMNVYGNRWAFSVEEFDPATKKTESYTHSTTLGANFKVEASGTFFEIVKLGAEFGGSITDQKSKTFTIETTEESDPLGTGIMSWTDPVVTGIRPKIGGLFKEMAITKEVNTGAILLSVEPVKIL